MRKQKRIRKYQAVTDQWPTAHITTNKSRIKNYPYNQIFMADGQEFQIELDNCTNYVWLAVISINGEKISDSGLVLKPGEHVFLDTPDIGSGGKKHKFKFETYDIEQGRSHLVADNGKVKIELYKERTLPHWISYKTYTYYPPYTYYPYQYPYRDTYPDISRYYYCSSGSDSADIVGGGSVLNAGASLGETKSSNSVARNVVESLNQVSEKNPCAEIPLGEPTEHIMPMEETGRVEKGSKSKQKFHKTNYDFEDFASYTEEFQIFPLSKRVVTIQEATREYCIECGKRRKKNHKFCSKCGTKF
jgi:hypothetical protein